MTAIVLKLLPDDEVRILETYINNEIDFALDEVYDTLGVPSNPTPKRIEVAVAQILLNSIQHTLPNWGSVGDDGTVIMGPLQKNRSKDARLNFNPQHVCTINWADSGPGFSWPEAYHVTFLPSYNKYIVTASRDGDDAYGCSDHAIGVLDGSLTPIEAAEGAITDYWSEQVSGWDQGRWAYLFFHGLIGDETANEWAEKVWPELEEEIEDEVE